MPLSEREKINRGLKILDKHYPHTNKQIKINVVTNAAARFNGDFSPIQSEHDFFQGKGRGLTYHQYVLLVASEQLGHPVDISKKTIREYKRNAMM